jgi:hypothetical protein
VQTTTGKLINWAILLVFVTAACCQLKAQNSDLKSYTNIAYASSTDHMFLQADPGREFGGIDSSGKPYLSDKDGNRKRCTRRKLIKAVIASKMATSDKLAALQYIGHPVNLVLYEVRK